MLYKQSGLKLALVLITASLLSACGNGKKELSEFTPIGATVSSNVAVDESSAAVSTSSVAQVASSSSEVESSSSAPVASSSSADVSSEDSSSSIEDPSAPPVAMCTTHTVEAGKAEFAKCVSCHAAFEKNSAMEYVSAGTNGADLFNANETEFEYQMGPSMDLADFISNQMGFFIGGCDEDCGKNIEVYIKSLTANPICRDEVSTAPPSSAQSSSAPTVPSSSSVAPSSSPVSSSVSSSVVATPSSIASSSTPIVPSSAAQSSSVVPVSSSSSSIASSSTSVESSSSAPASSSSVSSSSSEQSSSIASSSSAASSSSLPAECSTDRLEKGKMEFARCSGCHEEFKLNAAGDYISKGLNLGADDLNANQTEFKYLMVEEPLDNLGSFISTSMSGFVGGGCDSECGEIIADYIKSLSKASICPAPEPVSSANCSSADIALGKADYTTKGCAGCHGGIDESNFTAPGLVPNSAFDTMNPIAYGDGKQPLNEYIAQTMMNFRTGCDLPTSDDATKAECIKSSDNITAYLQQKVNACP